MSALSRIDQVIPTLASRDAIGQHCLELRDLLRSMGLDSDVFYSSAGPDTARQGHPLSQVGRRGPDDRALLYQLSIGSPAAAAFVETTAVKLVNYHNITPAELIGRWEPEVAEELRFGRRQLRQLAGLTSSAFADSEFNRIELESAGYKSSRVLPLLVDHRLAERCDRRVTTRLRRQKSGGGADLLFVGKVAPHKAQHDLIKALAVYRRLYDPGARLRLVGSPIGPAYVSALGALAGRLGLSDAVEFAGSVTSEALGAYYRECDVFLCLSDHEGFCVPIVEAMAHSLPVVAYGAGAVGETVGDAGVVLPAKDPVLVAAAVDRVVSDEGLRRSLAGAAQRRAAGYSLDRSRAAWRSAVEELLDRPAP